MSESNLSTPVTADQRPLPHSPSGDDFELNVRIVEAGPMAAVLMGDTDDGCDTVRGSDC